MDGLYEERRQMLHSTGSVLRLGRTIAVGTTWVEHSDRERVSSPSRNHAVDKRAAVAWVSER
jgi:hypothetical protein